MIKKIFALATVFALLAIATPAHAVLVDATFNGAVTSGGTVGAPVSGSFSYNTATFGESGLDGYGLNWGGPIPFSLTVNNSTTFSPGTYGGLFIYDNYVAETPGFPNTFSFTLQSITSGGQPILNLQFLSTDLFTGINTITDNFKYSASNVGGIGSYLNDGNTLDFTVNNVDIAPTPLPPSLLMFGAALIALAGVAGMRKSADKRSE